MPIPIPCVDFEATDSAGILKDVRCEQCQAGYVYWMTRSATGRSTSILFIDMKVAQERAAVRAAESLQRKLEKGCEVVPCPACGWIQEQMIAKARRDYWPWWPNVRSALYVLIAVFFALTMVFWYMRTPAAPAIVFGAPAALGICVLVAVALPITRSILSARYDPNAADQESRILLARTRALLREELEKQLAKDEPRHGPRRCTGVSRGGDHVG